MANMHLVTGYAGREHVTAADQGAFHNAFFGGGEFVLGTGNQFAASIVSNNQVRVLDGDIFMQGRFIRLDKDTYIDLAIENGASGYFRNDLIVARYTQNHATAIEEVNLVVIKGEAVMENPEDPAYTTGDILVAGDMLHDMPLYRVVIDGLNLVELVPLFSFDSNLQINQKRTNLLEEKTSLSDTDHFPVFDGSAQKHKKVLLSKIKDFLKNTFAAKSHYHAAGDITSGILPNARGGMGTSNLSEFAASLGVSLIEVCSYVGTGTYGASNPNQFTFKDVPKLIFLLDSTGKIVADQAGSSSHRTYPFIGRMDEIGTSYETGHLYQTYQGFYTKRSDDMKTLYWYDTKSAGEQLNASGFTYTFVYFV